LFVFVQIVEQITWPYENRRDSGVLCHSCDGKVWKCFDKGYPYFVVEPHNV